MFIKIIIIRTILYICTLTTAHYPSFNSSRTCNELFIRSLLIVDNNDTTVINFSVNSLWKFHYDHDRSTIITSNVRKEMANYARRITKHDARTISLRSYKVKFIPKIFLRAYLLSQPQPCRSLSCNELSAHRLSQHGTIFSARTWCRDPVPLCSLTKDLSPVSLRGA